MGKRIDLVADLGESFGNYRLGDDDQLLPMLTSANIACGFHAGDPRVMHRTIASCVAQGVSIGAHPGFPDPVGFGRRDMELTEHEVHTDTLYQVGALAAFAKAHGTSLAHVAPHGRLGNLVSTRPDYAKAVIDAVEAFDPTLIVAGLPGELVNQAAARGLRTAVFGVIDRAFNDDGSLVNRSEPGAVLHDPEDIAHRAVKAVVEGTVRSVNGVAVPVRIDSLLVHGDNAVALTTAALIRRNLLEAGVELAPLPSIVERGLPT